MSGYQRYDKKRKLSVVLAADSAGLTATAEATGIPKSTIAYWMDRPEFAEFRTKAREDLDAEVSLVAHLAWARVAETMSSMEPRDALFAADKATMLMLLIRGEATGRIEARDLTKEFDDHELDLLRSAIEREDSASTSQEAAVVGGGPEGSAPSDG